MPIYRLKNRHEAPPGGFVYIQHETGWDNRKASPETAWDFKSLCRAIQIHRRANRARFKWLSDDYGKIMDEVDAVNALRVSKIPNAEHFLIVSEDAPPKPTAPQLIGQKLVRAVDALKKAAIGGATLLEFEQSGEPPVNLELATARAQICSNCPKNAKGDLTRFFTVPASEMIRRQMERGTSLKLETPLDKKLGTCEACLCVLTLKVWTPIKFILNHMPDAIKEDLAPQCWVRSEAQ